MRTRLTSFIIFVILFMSVTLTTCGQAQEAAADEKIASVDDVLDETGNEQGTLSLTSDNQGSHTYTAASDCEVTISSCLETYGNAELSVTVNDEKVITWARSNDKDPAKLIVNGKEVEGSNENVGGGDFTPTTQKTKLKLKKGDKVTLNLTGDFGRANPHLSITGARNRAKRCRAWL